MTEVNEASLSITKPVSGWNKLSNADFRRFFMALTKAALNGFTGKWLDLIEHLGDAVAALGPEYGPGERAWILIRNALAHAIFELAAENADKLCQEEEIDYSECCDRLDLSLEQSKLTIDSSFFHSPTELPILESIREPFVQWLVRHGLPEAMAHTVSARLPSYFVFALNAEWQRTPTTYAPIREAFDTPFTSASEQERAWIQYIAWLQKQVDESIFGESFSLRQVFVPLRAYCWKKQAEGENTKIEEAPNEFRKQSEIKTVVMLQNELKTWLKKADASDAIRVVSGGPGCGKSSSTKMLAAEAITTGDIKVLYVPLYILDLESDFTKAVGQFLQNSSLFLVNPLDPKHAPQRLLLILDGLDELSMQGKFGADIANEFIAEVRRLASHRNYKQLRLQVLITGRQLTVQSAEAQFRKEREILHVLPYYLPKDERDEYDDPDDLLVEDQRETWWQRYGKLTGEPYRVMPSYLKTAVFREITSQPLLNYLVALSIARGKLDLSATENANQVYRDLLEGVYERAYEAYRPHRAVDSITGEEFARVLEEIALAIWHGNGRTASLRELEEYCKTSGLLHALNVFQEGAEAGVTRLLTAFYFRQRGRQVGGEPTFEFTHKSFGEYLAARRVVRGIESISREYRQRRAHPDAGWNETHCLKHWIELCGPSTMDTYLFFYILQEIQLRTKSSVSRWQRTLRTLTEFMLKDGMPMEQVAPRRTYAEETHHARNAKEALIAALNACARVTEQVNKMKWPKSTTAGALVAELQSQRGGSENVLLLDCLSFLDLSNSVLYGRDLFGANMERTKLHSAVLTFASLGSASLVSANLESANLVGANFARANLQNATLRNANAQDANFRGAKLLGSDLQYALLRNSDFRAADLRDANLCGAILEDTCLRHADLRGADLVSADLRGADLSDAVFNPAQLFRARR